MRLPLLGGLILAAVFAWFSPLKAQESVNFAANPEFGNDNLNAVLFRPASGRGPFPAIVMLHGCGGLGNSRGLNPRHRDWGERMAAQGYIVLMPDSFGSRGLGSQCRESERTVRASRERVADARAALAYLLGRQDVRPSEIALLGWSNGGSTVLSAVQPRHRPQGQDFRAAVAFYPGCRLAAASTKWSTRLPLLILMGEADDWTPAAPCKELAGKFPGKITYHGYPGAYHDFDHPDLKLTRRKGLAFSGSGDGTAHVGTDPAARADALARVPAWLKQEMR